VKEDVMKLFEHLRACKADQKTVSTELRLKQKGGAPLPVELVSARYTNQDAHSVQYRTAIIDITQRSELQCALERTQQDYRALVNSIQGLVWEGKARGHIWRFTYVSRQAEQLLGFPPQRWVMDRDFWEHRLHPEERGRVIQERAQALEEARNHVMEYRMIDAQRRPVWVRDSVNVTEESGGLRLHGMLINISELKEKDASVRRAHEELETRVGERTAELVQTCADLQGEMSRRRRLEQELLELTDWGRRQAMDVHGEVGQRLVGIGFMLKSLGVKL